MIAFHLQSVGEARRWGRARYGLEPNQCFRIPVTRNGKRLSFLVTLRKHRDINCIYLESRV